MLLVGCATPRSDVNLAPIYSRTTGADDVTEHEAAGGLVRARRDPVHGDLQSVEVRPLFGWRRGWGDPKNAPEPYREWHPPLRGDTRVDFLPPLGHWSKEGDVVRSLLAPVWFYKSRPIEGSTKRKRDLLALPGVLWSADETGTTQLAWFPIWGELDDFITYDQIRFVLFPLYVAASRADFTHHSVLFPILGWTENHPTTPDATPRHQFRIWPLFGYHRKPGRWSRSFFLWPLFTLRRDELWKPEQERLLTWMLWPLFGWTQRGTYRAVTTLWPFFGFAWDPRGSQLDPDRDPAPGPDPDDDPLTRLETEMPNPGGAYWAWDGPWPLVRIQSGGRSPAAEERTRLWPIYSDYRGDGLWWRTWAWPIVQQRQEQAPDYERASFYVIPFYQSYSLERTRPDGPIELPEAFARGDRIRWNKVWPLFKSEEIDEWRRDALLALTPTTRWDLFDNYWAWLWEVWALERNHERMSGRSWLGLYRYETDGYERRHSLPGLWSRRAWGEGEQRVSETSLLFGLLRWRSGPGTEDAGLMSPALPGPGWPARWTHREPTERWADFVAPEESPR